MSRFTWCDILSKFSRIFHPRSSWRVSSPSTGWWWPSSSPASSRPLGLAQTTHFTSEASRIKIFMKIEANIHCMILRSFLTWRIKNLRSMFQGLCALGSWAFCGSFWAGSRLCHWNRRRRWRTRHSAATQALCRHDPHSHLRRGAWALRAHRRHLPVRQEIERAVIYKSFFRGINNIHNQQSIGLS